MLEFWIEVLGTYRHCEGFQRQGISNNSREASGQSVVTDRKVEEIPHHAAQEIRHGARKSRNALNPPTRPTDLRFQPGASQENSEEHDGWKDAFPCPPGPPRLVKLLDPPMSLTPWRESHRLVHSMACTVSFHSPSPEARPHDIYGSSTPDRIHAHGTSTPEMLDAGWVLISPSSRPRCPWTRQTRTS